jgi:glycosyltransferase involved in cell wall biosynthesis
VPPVVTRVGGNAEVITNDVDGVLVPPGQVGALGDALVGLARDTDRRHRLAVAAGERARDFDIARTARIVEARYQALVRP